MIPEIGLSSFGMDCRYIFRIVDTNDLYKKGMLYPGTAVLVSYKGREFGYALTCWHCFDYYHKMRQFNKTKKLPNVWLLPRWARICQTCDERIQQPTYVVGKWSNKDQDFAVLKIPKKVIKEFRLHSAPVSCDIYRGMPLHVAGFQRPEDLEEQEFIPVKISKSSRKIKVRCGNQRVFEVYADPPRPDLFDTGISGGPFLYDIEKNPVVVGLASFVIPNKTGSHQYRGYGVPMEVVAETWTQIADYCYVVDTKPPPPHRFNSHLRTAYLTTLFKDAAGFSLAGIDRKVGASGGTINLYAVYTALLTLTPREHGRAGRREELPWQETDRLSALEQLNRHKHLVLLGDPGGGKSTFLNFVSICLAGAILEKPQANLELLTGPLPDDKGKDQAETQPWDHKLLLPVRVVLRDFAARSLPDNPQETAGADDILRFISNELGETLCEYAPSLKEELHKTGGLVLFDGLDEVPEADRRREQIKQAVESFAASFPLCRILVTSRTYAYQKKDWRLAGFQEAVLAPFSPGQVRRFIDRWYKQPYLKRYLEEREKKPLKKAKQLKKEENPLKEAKQLEAAIFNSNRLQALAERPILLTLMANIHLTEGELPENREQLYSKAVVLLLDWWEQQKVSTGPDGEKIIYAGLVEWLNIGEKVGRRELLNLIRKLAFTAYESQTDPGAIARIAVKDIREGLLDLCEKKRYQKFRPFLALDYLRNRNGLLLPLDDDFYTFPHRTFQEYLAACHLVGWIIRPCSGTRPAAAGALAGGRPAGRGQGQSADGERPFGGYAGLVSGRGAVLPRAG